MNSRNISPIQNKNYKVCGDILVESGREDCQLGWYAFASTFCQNRVVVDVGCGLGSGLQILSQKAKVAYGIDLDERLKKPNVSIKPISDIDAKSVDTVAAIDVIEHIEDDVGFIDHLDRVAREQIIVSTPNYACSRCVGSPYHVREYMPHELVKLFTGIGKIHLYKGSSDGSIIFWVKYQKLYFLLNKLTVCAATSLFAYYWNKILPRRMRIYPHLFMRILLR